jgi:hypothetical protein
MGMLEQNLTHLGFSTVTAEEADWLNKHVLHCGHIQAGEMWPFDPRKTEVTVVWPDIDYPDERLTAIRTSVEVLREFRLYGYARECVLEAAQYVWSVCCREG